MHSSPVVVGQMPILVTMPICFGMLKDLKAGEEPVVYLRQVHSRKKKNVCLCVKKCICVSLPSRIIYLLAWFLEKQEAFG